LKDPNYCRGPALPASTGQSRFEIVLNANNFFRLTDFAAPYSGTGCVAGQAAERSARAEKDARPAEGAPADHTADTEPHRQDARHTSHGHRGQGKHLAGRLQRSQHPATVPARRAVCRRRIRHAAMPVRLCAATEMLPGRTVRQIKVVAPGCADLPACSHLSIAC